MRRLCRKADMVMVMVTATVTVTVTVVTVTATATETVMVTVCLKMRKHNAAHGNRGEEQTHRCESRDVIYPHAVMSVQHSDLPPWADAHPVGNVLSCVEGEGVQQQQGQGKVVYKVALLGQLDVGFILLVHLTQQPV